MVLPRSGNTLLDVGVVTDAHVAFVVDRSSLQQGKLLSGSHFPVYAPEYLDVAEPGYVRYSVLEFDGRGTNLYDFIAS